MLSSGLAVIALLAILGAPALARAQSSGGQDKWQFTLAPYLILPWMDGKTAVKGRELAVDVQPDEIFSNLQVGGMGYFEARKARWGVGVDLVYMALGSSVDQPPANVDFNQGVYTFMGLRQLHERVDLVFGARWNVLQGKLAFKGPLQSTFEETKQWVEPIVGLKLQQPLGSRLHFTLEGDIGGFGAGSDFAWQLFPVVGVNVSKRATLAIGYRVLSEDYETGSGNQRFKYDVITQGIVLGMTFRF
jgi:hypothetical protein